jgi:hypothetical protein
MAKGQGSVAPVNVYGAISGSSGSSFNSRNSKDYKMRIISQDFSPSKEHDHLQTAWTGISEVRVHSAAAFPVQLGRKLTLHGHSASSDRVLQATSAFFSERCKGVCI